MRIKKLGLKNYRNCGDVTLVFPTEKTLIIGKNAQGKTNILESIYFLSDLKSPRTSTVSDLIQFNKPQFEINAEVVKNDTDIELDFLYTSEKKRELKINKVKSTPRDFKLVVKTVFFQQKNYCVSGGLRKTEGIGWTEQFHKFILLMMKDFQNMTKSAFKRIIF